MQREPDRAAPPFVLLSWGSHPGLLMPPRFSERQFTLFTGDRAKGPAIDPGKLTDHAWIRGSAPDLATALDEVGAAVEPDLVIVATDSMKHNQIRNLDRFACPRLLLVGDTHHGPTPLAGIMSYARQEKFDSIALLYTRQHAHWFHTAGFDRIAWMPGLVAKRCDPPADLDRPGGIGFVGQLGSIFPRRTKLIEAMIAAGLPIVPSIAVDQDYETAITTFPIGFNCSLNGDLNLRIFETIFAGAMLVTDELSAESGLPDLLTPGVDCETYGSEEHLVDLCRFYLANADKAADMAARGRQRLVSNPGLHDQAQRLVDWALGRPVSHMLDPLVDRRVAVCRGETQSLTARVSLYQSVQRRHADLESVHVLLGSKCPPALACDLMDLPRVRVTLERERSDIAGLLRDAGYGNRFRWQDETDLHSQPVDIRISSVPQPANGSAGETLGHAIDPRDPEAGIDPEVQELSGRYRNWRTSPYRPGVGRRRIVSVRNSGGTVRLIANDDESARFLLREIFEEKCYKTILGQDEIATIADVGANQGIAAAYFRGVYPAARIVCFEPFPGAWTVLAMNAVAIGNCEPMQYGLSDHDGEELFYPGLTGSAVGSFSRGALTQSNGIGLPVRAALDAFRECRLDAPDIVKIDTEGSERPILESLEPAIARVKLVYIEFHSEADRQWIDKSLTRTHTLWHGEIVRPDLGLLCYLRRDLAEESSRPASAPGLRIVVPPKN
jgi:FkbM family methyltransferase